MSLVGTYEEQKKIVVANTATSTATLTVTSSPVATDTTINATQIGNDFSNTDIHSEVKAEEEKEKKKQQTNSSIPLWYQADTYKDEDEGKDTSTITNEDVSEALNEIVAFELSEKGNEETLYYSNAYNQGFTNNGKVINGSCTEGGMRKAIVGGSKYITVTNADGETMSGVEAMADSYDSVLDLYTQSQFQKVLEEYGYGTFTNNCGFLNDKALEDIRKNYGIDIKVIESQKADGSRDVEGVQNRTFEISLIDENGNIIEDAEGNKSTILFGDWVIPDGTAQGAEFDFISVIDQAGYDCISKADFMSNEAFAANPEFQDANGNYDAGKAYAYVLGQIETEFNNLKSGKESDVLRASEQTINEATYVGSTFTWWSAGGNDQYYSNSGLNPTTADGVDVDLIAKYDLDGDGDLNEDELKTMIENEVEDKDEAGKDKEKGAAAVDNSNNEQVASGSATVSVLDTMKEAQKALETRLDELRRENKEMTEEEIIYQAADELAKKYDLEANDIIDTYKY